MNAVLPPASGQLVVKGSDLPAGLALVDGTTFQAGVKTDDAQQLYVLLQGKKLLLPSTGALVAGQRVSVTVTHAGPDLVLEVKPGPTAPGRTAGAVDELVPRLVRMLGGEAAAPQAASQLMSLFTDNQGGGAHVSTVSSTLHAAQSSGAALSPSTLQLSRLLTELLSFETAELPRLLEQLAKDASVPAEARLAKAGTYQEIAAALDGSLKALLARLGQDAALMQFVDERGGRSTFEQAVDVLIQRFDSRDLQNLRGLEHPYLFFEVPLPDKGPLRRAFIHVFGRKGRAGEGAPGPSTVALDLETRSLGSVWVTLRLHRGRCACQFRAQRRSTGALIEASARGLRESLHEAGYSDADVTTAPWRAGRLAETAAWMRTMDGIDARV